MTARHSTEAEAPGCSTSWPVRAEDYRLVSTCGKGSTSIVYCALCVPRGEMVTVKVRAGVANRCIVVALQATSVISTFPLLVLVAAGHPRGVGMHLAWPTRGG